MDSSSWALLKRVLDEVKPLTVVLTTRPMEEKKAPKEYADISKSKLLAEEEGTYPSKNDKSASSSSIFTER